MAVRRRPMSSLAGAVIIALGGCGGGSHDTSTEPDNPSTTTAPPPAPVTTTTTAAPPRQSDPPFSLRLPPGWRDVTALASRESGLAQNEDVLVLGSYAGPEAGGLTPSVLVSRPALARLLSLRAFAGRTIARLHSRPHGTVSAVRKTELDGAPAVTFADQLGHGIGQRQVLVKDGSDGLQIVFTAPRREFQRYLPDFERILASWRWKA